MIRWAIVALFFILLSSACLAQGIEDELPTNTTADVRVDHRRYEPKEKNYDFLYAKDTKKTLYGNPCAIDVTQRMGFMYAPLTGDEKTVLAKLFRGLFITGDMGVIDERGYISIVGRAKDLIISGGFNVYPKEIESLIDDLGGVNESAVIGVPHPDFGEGVVAVVVPQTGAEIDESSVASAIAGELAKFKQPKKIFIAEELPRNTMGKVQKNVLRDRYKDLFG